MKRSAWGNFQNSRDLTYNKIILWLIEEKVVHTFWFDTWPEFVILKVHYYWCCDRCFWLLRHLDLELLQCARIIICSELHGNLVFLQFHSFWKTLLYVMVFPRYIFSFIIKTANISYQEIAICSTSWESLSIVYSCNNITTTLIQISRLFYFGFFSNLVNFNSF